ncbi:hypothetical protein, partial [Streptomyces rimosus]
MFELDWQGRHTLNTGAATAVTSALAVSSLTYVSGVDPLWDAGIAAAGALGSVLAGARSGHLPATLTYRAGLWA